jgi:hypothetical protein
MGVTVTTFLNDTTMVAADMRANLEALRQFTNRGAVIADFTGTFRSRNFVRPESYGMPSPRTVMASAVVWGSGETGAVVDRAYATYDSMDTTWRWVPGASRTILVPEAGIAEITVNAWAWHVHSEQEFPEVGTYDNTLLYAAKMAIRVGGTVQTSTERRVWDAGRQPLTNYYESGFYRYSAVNRSMSTLVQLAEGEQTVGLVSKMEEMTDTDDLGRLVIGGRGCIIEFMRR